MPAPSAKQFDRYRVTQRGVSEILKYRLYDSNLYPAAGSTQITFFGQTVGQGVTTAQGAVVGSGKTNWDTNIEAAGTLPSGKEFLVQSIELLMLPGASSAANTYTPAQASQFAAVAAAALLLQLNDVNSFYQSGLLELNVLSKNYVRDQPLLAFPPKTHLDVSVGVASNSATTAEAAGVLAKAAGRPYYLDPPITLQPAVNFDVTLRWPAAVAMPSGFNARVVCYLDGFLKRAAQ